MQTEGRSVIGLGIGDPDGETYAPIVAAAQRAFADPATHRYSTNRGRAEFRTAVAEYYDRRFGVDLDPESMVMPALGAKECIFNINLAFLGVGDVALAPDPGYPVFTSGPLIAGAEPVFMPLDATRGYAPDLGAIQPDVARRAKLMYLNYPNTPTGAAAPEGFFADVVRFARKHELLVVHDNVYSEITFDGYRAPSFLETEGAIDVGVEVFSLSKTYNMTGWRCAALVGNATAVEAYRRLKSCVDSGIFSVVQLAGVTALDPSTDPYVAETVAMYQRRRDLVCAGLRAIGFEVSVPQGAVYVWVEVPSKLESSFSFCSRVLDETGVVLSPGSAYGAAGEGFFRLSLTASEAQLREAIDRLSRLSDMSSP
jgi:LL-diaminopimelate aminotransferase